MLPILPALLLLLVNAPSTLDRADCVRAIGALESLHRQFESGAPGPDGDRELTQRALASLLALRVPPAEFGLALATLLQFDVCEPTASLVDAVDPGLARSSRQVRPPLARLQSGALEGRRSRDGPAFR